ncbi:hypothetical protein J6590_058884 [Homalodisca vitripennis]|nr:hypothetical protein J6590_058884 [Homalodisca vitripennis]
MTSRSACERRSYWCGYALNSVFVRVVEYLSRNVSRVRTAVISSIVRGRRWQSRHPSPDCGQKFDSSWPEMAVTSPESGLRSEVR